MEDSKKAVCACCGSPVESGWGNDYYCPECHWMGDRYQEENPDEAGLVNSASLNMARAWYKKYGPSWFDKYNGTFKG